MENEFKEELKDHLSFLLWGSIENNLYICKVCKKEFNCHQQLNGHKQTHRKSKKQIEYELNPKPCKECGDNISWKSFRTKTAIEFCCVSCRAKFFYKKSQNIEENSIL